MNILVKDLKILSFKDIFQYLKFVEHSTQILVYMGTLFLHGFDGKRVHNLYV